MSVPFGRDAMSVYKRKWKTLNGQVKEAWVHEYKVSGKRHIKTFAIRKEAVAFRNKVGTEIAEGVH
jgi:integrase